MVEPENKATRIIKEYVASHKSKHINFIPDGEGKQWGIYALKNQERIGSIEYYPRWRQIVFVPNDETIWAKGCLIDIVGFLEFTNKELREKWKAKKRAK